VRRMFIKPRPCALCFDDHVGKCEPEKEPTQSWAVTVERNGEQIVTIESNCVSGRDISDEDARVIRTAAHHLQAFLSDPEPACELCSIEDGLVREWLSKARAVARSKGLLQ
jgi:hypothetical protein